MQNPAQKLKDLQQNQFLLGLNRNTLQSHKEPSVSLEHKKENYFIFTERISCRIQFLIIVVIIQMITILLYCIFKVIGPIDVTQNYFSQNKQFIHDQKFVSQFQQIKKFSEQIKDNHLKYINDLQEDCQNVSGLFHVQINDNHENQLMPFILQKRAKKCQIPIYEISHLKPLISKWNRQYPQNKIKLTRLSVHDHKMLLIFLQLYYYAGTYVDHREILSSIHNRCWKLAIIDFDILFASTKEILENGVRLPDFQKFIRVKYPYTPMVKNMIQNIINEEDYDQQCRQRQCIIIQCIQSFIEQKQESHKLKEERTIPVIRDKRKAMQKYNQNRPQHIKLEQNVEYNIFSFLSFTICLTRNNNKQANTLTLNKCRNSSNQRYKLSLQKDNHYKIMPVGIENSTMKVEKSSNKIVFDKISNSSDQIWQIIPSDILNFKQYHQSHDAKNSFFIRSNNGYSMNLPGMSIDDKTQLIIYKFQKNINQLWIIEPAYKEQFQFATLDLYYQNLINMLFYINSFNKKTEVQYLKLKIQTFKQKQPFWLAPFTDKYKLISVYYNLKQIGKQNGKTKFDTSQFYHCVKNHTIAYIWFGTKGMPEHYRQILARCKENVKLLDQKDFEFYSKRWNNQIDSEHKINGNKLPVRQQINMLKLLYLYYQSGIYSDFDTQINQQCFQNIYTDQIIWTNHISSTSYTQIIYPQQSFIMVRDKFNPQIKNLLLAQMYGDKLHRWDQCKSRQCFIVYCQKHNYDRTYKNGYD